MRKYYYLPLLFSLLGITACSPLPQANNVIQTSQAKLQSAQHWGVIADHLSDQLTQDGDLLGKSLYIDESRYNTDFSKVFSKQLVSELVKKDVDVNLSSSPTFSELEIDVDVVRHPNDRDKGTGFPMSIGLASAWFIVKTKGYGVIPAVVAAEYMSSEPSRTNTEIAVTTRVMEGNSIQFSETHIYYITDQSIKQFKTPGSVSLTDKEVPGGL
ncbi:MULTISPECIES: hypothetical protein [unclassified Endozoicomonas]|uniref:hypothetical protein n=1 Tax=unclassified Endozoicomonas TaxID=2644528 RepID=UPI002147D489|nr:MULTISPECIES: hypothetical protein [unclassified Endozoicomonas]